MDASAEALGDQLASAHPQLLLHSQNAATPEAANELITEELTYIGLLDRDDESRLRVRDCEDDGLCIQIRAWQDSLRVVSGATDVTRKALKVQQYV